MKFTEEEIIDIQKLTQQLIKDVQSERDPKYIKLTIDNLKTIVDVAIFNDWCNRTFGNNTH